MYLSCGVSLPRMRTIAIFVKNLTSGGAEKQSVLLAKVLASECDVHYVIFNGNKIHEKYLEMLRVDSRIAVKSFKGSHVSRYRDFVSYLRSNKISAIFSYLTAANLYACMAGKLVGADVYTGLRNAQLPLMKRVADCLLANWFAKKAVANSYSGKINLVSKGFKDDKLAVIPNCFENISPYAPKQIKSVLRVITVGRFVRQKDYETAIRAVAGIRSSAEMFRFSIVGYGELEASVRMWTRKYGVEDIVDIHINPNNIQDLLNEADIYMSTSLFEGTSNSIMEAMEANLPIVATDVGDNNRLIQNGENGFLCQVGDYVGISKSLLQLISNASLRSAFGKKSKQLLQEHYSVSVFRERYLKLLGNE